MRYEVSTEGRVDVVVFCVVTPCCVVGGFKDVLEEHAASIFRPHNVIIQKISLNHDYIFLAVCD
jgi:hypothetical protein